MINSAWADVIEAIRKHCGLRQSRSARPPPEVNDLVLELNAAYSGSWIDSPEQTDQSEELTYVDIAPLECLILPGTPTGNQISYQLLWNHRDLNW